MRTDGTLHFVEEAQSLDDARARVQKLAQLWPGEYIISNRVTGERVSITAGRKPDYVRWGVRCVVVDSARRVIPGALILASLPSAVSELQAPAWSCLAEPSLWPTTKRERVSSCGPVLLCDVVSLLLDQRPLSRTLHTHPGWIGSFQSGHA